MCRPAVHSPAAVDDGVTDTDATPPFNVGEPKGVRPSRNETAPVAVLGVTLAVKITACDVVDGFSEDVSEMLEDTLLTVCVSTGDVLPALFPSPL